MFAFADGEDYSTRKGDYTIKWLVIFDDAARITWIEVGWPGSVHDNRVCSNSEIYVGRDKYFNQKEYLPGDSAFSTSAVMIPAFKKATTPIWARKKTLTPSWQRLESRASTAGVYSKRSFNACGVSTGYLQQSRLRCYCQVYTLCLYLAHPFDWASCSTRLVWRWHCGVRAWRWSQPVHWEQRIRFKMQPSLSLHVRRALNRIN